MRKQRGASDRGVIIAAVAAGGQYRSALDGRFLVIKPLGLFYYSMLDPFSRGPGRRAL